MRQSQLNFDSKTKKIFPNLVQKLNVTVTILPVQKQPDGYNCGLFAVAFAAKILDNKSTIDTNFHVPQLRNHLIYCLETGALTPFPKI